MTRPTTNEDAKAVIGDKAAINALDELAASSVLEDQGHFESAALALGRSLVWATLAIADNV